MANLLKSANLFSEEKGNIVFYIELDEKANPFGKLQRSVILLTRKEEMRSSCF
jgi:hypothetical protein